VKTEVENDLEALKKALENTEDGAASEISAALAKLNESSQKMGAAMYAAGEADASAAGGTTGTGDSDDDVVDAEIVDEDTNSTGEGENK
jgi:molecular chaperone DnaK